MLTPAELQNHVGMLISNPRNRNTIMHMIESSPARKVGESAKDNIVTHFPSLKNGGDIRVLESRTVESVRALELELDPDVLAYFTQVRCVGIERYNGTHVSNATVDMLIVRRNSIAIEEAKPLAKVEQLLQSSPDEWRKTDGRITRPAFDAWASVRELKYNVFCSPKFIGPYLANLELLYASLEEANHQDTCPSIEKALELIRRKPLSIAELCQQIRQFTPALAISLLARRKIFGAIRHVTLCDIDSFMIYADATQQLAAEARYASAIDSDHSQSHELVMTASSIDREGGMRRLARVDEYLESGKPPPPYWRPLVEAVQLARANGENDLAPCLTSMNRSGNRGTRLLPEQVQALETAWNSAWKTGIAAGKKDFRIHVNTLCEAEGIRTPSLTAISRFLERKPDIHRTLNTGGLRKYHAQRSASDPRVRSTPALARHMVLEVDSTKCDNKSCASSGNFKLFESPLIYIGIDGCTGEPMCSSFVFGPARRDGLALLLRDYVQRHKCLPREIRVDRGTENKSYWLKAFCKRYRIRLVIMPSGGSRYKGGIENLLGRLNTQVSHRLAGSTFPDQAGRAVDGRFRSYRTARHHFSVIRQELQHCLFNDFRFTPDADGISPDEKRQVSLDLFPNVGRHQLFDDEFLFMTSIPLRAREFSEKKGLRTWGRCYTSQELLEAVKSSKILDVRRNPSDPSQIWVQHERGTQKAWSSATLRLAHATTDDRVFHSLFVAVMRGESQEKRDEIQRERHRRLTAAANSSVEEGASAAESPQSAPNNSPPNPPVSEDGGTSSAADVQRTWSIKFSSLRDLETHQ